MFHGANFVHNHILNRHKEAVKEDVEVKVSHVCYLFLFMFKLMLITNPYYSAYQ